MSSKRKLSGSDTSDSSSRVERKVDPPKPGMKRVKIDDPIDARVEMINGTYALTKPIMDTDGKTVLKEGTGDKMAKIRGVLAYAAREIVKVIREAEAEGHPKADTGRVIAGIDALQGAKNIFCDALILPHAHKDVKESE